MRKTIIVSLCSLFVTAGFSQSVGIGTNMPDSSAQLDVVSNNKGFLPPRIALQSLDLPDPVSKPALGLLVYNTDTAGVAPNNVFPGYYYWNGSVWSKISHANNHQLPGFAIRNLTNPVSSSTKTKFTVPPGKVWKINYQGPNQIASFGNQPIPTTLGTDLDKYDIFLNEKDSFSVTPPYFISIAEYSTSFKSIKTFNDSVPANSSKSYIVPANKVWKPNFFINPIGGLSVTVGNPGIGITIPTLYDDMKSNANNFLISNTVIKLTNTGTESSKFFFSVSEFDE